MLLRQKAIVSSVVVLALAGNTVLAESPRARDWARVTGLRPDRRITVALFEGSQKFKGTFQIADEEGLVLRVPGKDLRLDRARIRRISLGRSTLHSLAPVVGAAVGMASIGPYLHRRHGFDFVWSAALLVAGGIGAGVGFLVRPERVLYEAPSGP